jgi:7-cyano-7-deazaguanine synthase
VSAGASGGAVVLLSGGQDSTTCLYWALREFGRERTAALSFDYGQRHRVELEAARRVAELAGVEHAVLCIDTFAQLGGNALTDSAVAVPIGPSVAEPPGAGGELPITFVPGRNLIFLTFAAAWAYGRRWPHLVVGVAQTDYSGYPDCREGTLRALEQSLRLGMELDFQVHAPLMQLSKRQTVELARELGALSALAYTHTCYNGARPPCGRCAACELRARGFREAGVPDPLLAAACKAS